MGLLGKPTIFGKHPEGFVSFQFFGAPPPKKKTHKKVAPFHMAANVNDLTNEMTFLYKFLPGLCPASHGHNVAKIAGLPEKAGFWGVFFGAGNFCKE